jgi:FlaA1/EpsC-like NDP-sugar epimerase
MRLLSGSTPIWIIFAGDLLISFISLWIAYLLRFEFHIPDVEWHTFPVVFPALLSFRALGFYIFSTHRTMLRFSGSGDLRGIILATVSGSLLLTISNPLYYLYKGLYTVPFSIIAIELMFTTSLMAGARFLARSIYQELTTGRGETYQVLIFGAGETALMAKRAIERDAGTRYRVVGFLDDDPLKMGKKFQGIPVKRPEELSSLIQQQKVRLLILASEGIPAWRRKELIEVCLANQTKVFSVPPVRNWINGELSFKQIKKININDLLQRDPIVLDMALISAQLHQKRILVSGAAGSIGSELVRQVLRFAPSQLILLDQAESALYELEREIEEEQFGGSCVYIVGDITNQQRMAAIFLQHKPEVVFHAAAYKHVPLMESNPAEAVQVNIIGTRIIADLSSACGVEKFVMVSTDKAVRPTNVMGASKRIAEMYVQSLGEASTTRFITTRFGNVLGSNGSVIPIFRKQIEKGGPVTVTHPEITRYFMTISEASQLVLEASAMGQGGEIFIFDMGKSVKIVDLVRKMIQLSGLTEGKDIEIVYTGLRPGEKLYEELLNDQENTLPTHHHQIMRASIVPVDFELIRNHTDELAILAGKQQDQEIVKLMKVLVPDYISNNSVFELLD